ncbi:hypothetical protein VPH35_069012 [Triticum aestivum]
MEPPICLSLKKKIEAPIRTNLENGNNYGSPPPARTRSPMATINSNTRPRSHSDISRSISGASASLMAWLAMDVGEDYLHLPQDHDHGEDFLHLPHDDDHGEDYLHLPHDHDHDEYTREALSTVQGLLLLHPRPPGAAAYAAGIIPRVGVAAAPRDSELAAAVAKALTTVDAPSDGRGCPICLDDDQVSGGAWKETKPCGHRFHGRCVQPWLQAKGSCPMCRRQVVARPTQSSSWAILSSGGRLLSS